MDVLTELCSCPTAPFAEYYVAEYIREFVGRHPQLKLSSDRFGNLLIAPRNALEFIDDIAAHAPQLSKRGLALVAALN